MSKKRKKHNHKIQSSNIKKTTKKDTILNLLEIAKEQNNKNKKNKRFLIMIIIFEILIIFGLTITILKTNNKKEPIEVVPQQEEVKESVYLFLGDSITNQYDLDMYYPELKTINSGINGNTTDNILEDMKNRVFQHNPTDVIILIGINQIERDEVDMIVSDIKQIVDKIKIYNNQINVYIQSIYPINAQVENTASLHKDNNKIIEVNKKLKEYSEQNGVKYIDIYDKLLDEDGNLNTIYTKDGLHLNSDAYKIITQKVMEVIK